MTSFFSLSLWKRVRMCGLFALLLVLLGVQRCTDERNTPPAVVAPAPARFVSYRPAGGDTSTSARPNLGRKALPRSRWHAVPGPAYLVYPLPRRPRQAQLDIEAARAAQLHKI